MARRGGSVSRSASTGRFVPKATAGQWPGKTTTESVGRGTSNARTVNRSAVTGRFITKAGAASHPSTSMQQRV